MTAQDAEDLEKSLVGKDGDLDAHVRLVGYYFSRSDTSAMSKHLLWLLREHPEIDLGRFGTPSPECIPEARRILLDHIDKYPADPLVLEHASRHLARFDEATAEEMMLRGASLDVSPRWHTALAQMMTRRARRARTTAASPLKEHEAWAKAHSHYEMALTLCETPDERIDALIGIAETSLAAGNWARAGDAAEQLIANSGEVENTWNYGNAVHIAHIVLGKIALQFNDEQHAGLELIKAGDIPGSPQLDTFGPDMSLASELIERGVIEPVITYLKSCRRFWLRMQSKLDEWVSQLESGARPSLHRYPDL
jgi:hypothetical protein